MVEMFSKYVPVLKEQLVRLKQAICKLKTISIVSCTKNLASPNEFINISPNHVMQLLVMDIRSAKYFGIVYVSTPDISRTLIRCQR